jgi:tetratricopeptide (TPR) repeat protein
VTQAGPLGYGPTRAEALYQKGYDQDQTGDSQGAEETLFDAFVAAQEASHPEIAARAASQLAWTTGWIQARTAEGHRWSRLAMAIAEGARIGDGVRADLFQQLGGVFANERRYAEAAEASLRALRLNERALGRDHIRLAPVLTNLGEIYNQLGHYQEALRYTQRGLELRKRGLEPGHPDFGRSYNALGNIYDRLDRYQEAAAAFERALAIYERHYSPSHWLIGGALGNLGSVYQHLGRLETSLRYDRRALASFEGAYGPEHPNVAMVLADIGETLRLQGKPAEALATLGRARSIQEKALAPDDPDRAVALLAISRSLMDLGRAKEGVSAGERALVLLEGKPLDPKLLQKARFSLARVLWDEGNHARAVRLAVQAREGLAEDGHLDDQHEVESWLRQRGQTW